MSQITVAARLTGEPPPVTTPAPETLRSADLGPGSQVGGYRIESLIGRGGMGLVYKAHHDRLQRVAAVKVLARYGSSAEGIKRFEREAQTVARLRHPHIMAVFDFGEFGGQPFMVAEYMPNGSMQSRMPEGPAPPAEAIAVLGPLASALDYAHEQGVIHRDVKPANVFLDADFKPVLADFGLAKLHSDVDLTATGTVSGTPSYIAPEQATGAALSGATDRYSLAVMAYRLFSGQLPFKGSAVMDVLYAHVHSTPAAPSELNPSLPAAIDAVLMKGLAKDPAQRWATCTEMVDALEAAVEGTLDVGAITEPAVEPVAPTEPSLPAARRQRGGRSRLLLVVVATVLVSVVAAVAGLSLTGQRLAPPRPSLPASAPATASRHLSVAPVGPVQLGQTVTVTGSGYTPGSLANVGMPVDDTHVMQLAVSPVEVSADGTFSITFVVPANLKSGPATFRACNVEGQDRATNCVDLPVTLAG